MGCLINFIQLSKEANISVSTVSGVCCRTVRKKQPNVPWVRSMKIDCKKHSCLPEGKCKYENPNVRITKLNCLDHRTLSDVKNGNIALEKAIVFFTAKFLN